MKRLIIMLSLATTLFLLTGCNSNYVRIERVDGNTTASIPVDADYTFQDFKKDINNDECIITVRFKRQVNKN